MTAEQDRAIRLRALVVAVDRLRAERDALLDLCNKVVERRTVPDSVSDWVVGKQKLVLHDALVAAIDTLAVAIDALEHRRSI